MILFASDLDNTLIYSYKHEIGNEKICVEIYQNREVSFMTEQSYQLLQQIKKQVLFVPITTRTLEQYQRIDLGFLPDYALVSNGGVLLQHGKEDAAWYEESLTSVLDCQTELKKAEYYLEKDENRNFEIRNIRSLFLFTKSRKPQESIQNLKKFLDLSLVDVFGNGVKVYVVPKKLSKGEALKRFRMKRKAETIFAAGDSEFDIPMLEVADVSLLPEGLKEKVHARKGLVSFGEEVLFSDAVLKRVLVASSKERMPVG
ncbi:MAG: HAD hydrolase family protein [Lachnospiraceae bacterium]|nr:HAD hydrolase family protein [Lachnospiraceae bacterium]